MLTTPYYLIDKAKLQNNMQILGKLSALSGAKTLLALKCFACWSVFDVMRPFMHGTTSSSLYELRLGRECFGKETHGYSVAFAPYEIKEALSYCDKMIFNSYSQLINFAPQIQQNSTGKAIECGLRLNPHCSYSHFDLADPARRFSRLGESNREKIAKALPLISGFMIHNNCENSNFKALSALFDKMEERFGEFLYQIKWLSLGGGIHFTAPDYPLAELALRLKNLAQKYDITLYLEPGEAAITGAASLETTVIDIVENEKKIAIIDSSIEAHMLDLLTYRESAKILPNKGPHSYIIAGKSCLAGDIFGEYNFPDELQIGSRISISDAAGYTMVKKNWFNGVAMPAIVIKELDGSLKIQKSFDYHDYKNSLS